ncbi:MAG: hypothetical protein ACM32J_05415, partial [Rhizobacter sp.]
MPRPPASVVTALETALQQSPHDLALRNHVAQLLVDDERPEAAIDLCTGTLALDPANLPALALAALLARRLGRPTADGYERLLTALGGSVSPAPAPEAAPASASASIVNFPAAAVPGI